MRGTTTRRALVAAAALTLAWIAPGEGAAAEETDGEIDVGFFPPGPQVQPWIRDTSNLETATCSAQAKVWVKEIATSGISRMRISFHTYAHYSPTAKLLARESTSEVAYPADGDVELPDDDRSFYIWTELPWGLLTGDKGEQVVARFVGERPSIWNPDRVDDIAVGELTCAIEACLGEAGVTCAENVPDGEPEGGGGVTMEPGHAGDPSYQDADQDGVTDDVDPTPNGEPPPRDPNTPPGTFEYPGI